MADDQLPLGPSVTEAIRFLSGIYKDIHQLLAALDGLMIERGWEPTEKSRVSYQLSNSNTDPAGWLLEYLFRFFVPAGSLSSIRRLIGFVVRCSPPPPFNEPMLLCVAAFFPEPTDWVTIYQGWKSSERLLSALAEKSGPRVLSTLEADQFLPRADRLFGTAVPLCGVTDTEGLLGQCIAPLITWQQGGSETTV